MNLARLFKRAAPAVDVAALESAVAERVAADVVAKFMRGSEELVARRRGVAAYAMDNPYAYLSPQSPRQHPDALVSLDVLRRLADLYDPLRACINHLKREVAAVPLRVVARDDRDDSVATKQAIAAAGAFLTNGGGLGGAGKRRGHFESEIIEDLCVVGASAINYQPTRGGGVHAVATIDAATIRPLIDEQGHIPADGEEAYVQWVMGRIMGRYTRAEVYYDGIYPVSYSPYFKSPVEYLVNTINSALRAVDWNRKWLTDGNSPARLFGAPDDWTPSQIREFQEYLDAMLSGNTAARQKAKIVPGGFKDLGQTRKDQDFQEFELWLLRRTCAIMGVAPASIGFAGEQYKVAQEGSQQGTTQFGAGVLIDFLNAFYDDLWVRLGYPQLITQRVTAREEDAAERARRNQILVAAGIKSINEARADEGLDPKPGADDLLLSSGVRPLQAIVKPSTPEEAHSSDSQPRAEATEPEASAARALHQWERKSLNRLKQGKPPLCRFESDALPREVNQFVAGEMSRCATRAQVRDVFAAALTQCPDNVAIDSGGVHMVSS
jgi:hypothetical protein